MARSESESNLESTESLSPFKDKVRGLSKAKAVKLLFTIMDECGTITTENCMLKGVCSELKKDVRMLERNKLELEHVNEILKYEKLRAEEKALALCEDLDMLKDLMNTREEVFNTNLSRLKSESLDLKLRLESLVTEKTSCLKRLTGPNLTSLRTGTETVLQKHLTGLTLTIAKAERDWHG